MNARSLTIGTTWAGLLLLSLPTGAHAQAEGPNFDCRKAGTRTVPQLICQDAALSSLDRQLAVVYAAALKKATTERPPVLRAHQRGWIKGRDDCWKSTDVRVCVDTAYRQRIAELQALYRLVDSRGPFTWACDGPAGGEVVTLMIRTFAGSKGDGVACWVKKFEKIPALMADLSELL